METIQGADVVGLSQAVERTLDQIGRVDVDRDPARPQVAIRGLLDASVAQREVAAMARRTRKRRKKPEESSLFYTVAITGWSWAFDFGVNRGNRLSSDPYSEHRHLEIKGRLLEPDGIKAECALVTLMPDARLNQSSRQKDTAHAVVSINVRDGVLYGLGSMPGDALAPVLQLLSAQRPVYLFLHGERLRYRKALIWSYRLDTAWEGDEQAEAEPPGD